MVGYLYYFADADLQAETGSRGLAPPNNPLHLPTVKRITRSTLSAGPDNLLFFLYKLISEIPQINL